MHKGKIHYVDCDDNSDNSSTDTEELYCLDVVVNKCDKANKPVYCEMLVGEQSDKSVSFQIDCGATVNVLPSKYVSNSDIIKDDNSQKVTLKMWNGTMVDSIGTYRIKVKNPKTGKKYRAPFVLVKNDFTPLISRKTAEDMGIITINYEIFKPVHIVQDNSCADIRSEFPKPFENGVGQFSDDLKTVKLHADDGVPAKVVPA